MTSAPEFSDGQGGRPGGLHDHFPLRRVDILTIGAFWTLLAVLTAANGMLDPRGGRTPSLSWWPVGLAFATSLVWAALTPVIFWFGSRVITDRTRWASRALLLLGAGIVVAVLVETISSYMRFELFAGFRPPAGMEPRNARPYNPLFGVSRLFWIDDLIVYIAVLSAGFARDSFLRYRARQEETIRLRAQAAELNAQLADARLDALRRQLHPHFLFNTLHAVSSLVERDPRGVRRMISRLSDLLRYSIDGANTPEITLRKELELLGRYVDIMAVRFQGRLEFDTRVDDAALDALVPNLILQPLVENAIKHGVEKLTGPGRVEIEASVEGSTLVLRVIDNGAPPSNSGEVAATPADDDGAPSPGGVGLRNTVARLAQLYGNAGSFVLRPGEQRGTVAEVRLPLHTDVMSRGATMATTGEVSRAG